MNVNVIRCPNCGGDVDLNAKVCPYCNSDIICSEYDGHKKLTSNILIAARNDISSGKYSECRSHIDDAISIDPDCADAWFMSAALYSADDIRFEQEKERASSCSNRYGIFGESDLKVYRKKARLEKKKGASMIFLMIGFFILFFGGVLSLGLGIGLGTLIPLYVTLGLLAILLVVYLLVTMRYNHDD